MTTLSKQINGKLFIDKFLAKYERFMIGKWWVIEKCADIKVRFWHNLQKIKTYQLQISKQHNRNGLNNSSIFEIIHTVECYSVSDKGGLIIRWTHGNCF